MSKNKRILLFIVLLFVALPFIIAASPNNNLPEQNNKPNQGYDGEVPNFGEVSVHDPSIIKDGDTFYAFGTHIEAAKSEDLISWDRFTNGYETPDNSLYGDLSENLAGSFEWAGEDDADSSGGFAVWAPDIFYNEDYVNEDGSTGAYMIYYSASSTYIRSAIGYAVAQDIEGPYEYVDTILYSGFTRDEAYDENSDVNKQWENTNIKGLIDDGTLEGVNADWFNSDSSYNNTMYPNAIDATLFYDDEGKLWMTYGSWSGGIFLLELDKETGQPIYPGENGTTEDGRMIDEYFGTKIAGGYTKSGEGPYIVYDEETGYYYLYVTYGWLGADGGYHMRAFRATEPDGPYLDVQDQDAVLPGDVSNHTYGNKLMGNFIFERKVGDPGEGDGLGYVSPGHNSVYLDRETDEHYLIFHSRFPNTGEVHEMRVHNIYMNEDDWPVIAPYRYSGESLEKVNKKDLSGDYKYINHGQEYGEEITSSENITLHKNNKVTGAVEGTWKKTGQYNAELTLDGSTYKGVFANQWDSTSESYVMTFTAMSDKGIAVWGSKQQPMSDEEVVEAILEDLNFEGLDALTNNLDLPTEGTHMAEISWESSDASVITDEGNITRGTEEEGAQSAVLTATITKNDESATKTFDVTVPPYENADLTAHFDFEGNLADQQGSFGDGTVTGSRITEEGGNLQFDAGVNGNAIYFDGSTGVNLPDKLITSNKYSVSFWLNPEELSTYTTTFFGGTLDNWISLVPKGPTGDRTMLWSGSSSWYDATASYQINTNEWTHVAFSVNNGTVKLYLNGEEEYIGSNFPDVLSNEDADFALAVNHWDTPFKGYMDELKVFEGEISPNQLDELSSNNE